MTMGPSSRHWRLPRSRPAIAGAVVLAGALISGLVMAGLPGTSALFTTDQPRNAVISAANIFRDERVTPAFVVNDVSSGSAQDGSSVTAFANDGRYLLTRSWPAAFANDRYLDLEFNAPLPAALSVAGAMANLRLSSDAGTGSVCVYLELRRVSDGGLLSSHGSAGSPLACTAGGAPTTLNVSLTAVDDTDVANDLRLRVFGRDSVAGQVRLDEATIAGASPYASFTLYPILTREQYDGQTELLRWGLAWP